MYDTWIRHMMWDAHTAWPAQASLRHISRTLAWGALCWLEVCNSEGWVCPPEERISAYRTWQPVRVPGWSSIWGVMWHLQGFRSWASARAANHTIYGHGCMYLWLVYSKTILQTILYPLTNSSPTVQYGIQYGCITVIRWHMGIFLNILWSKEWARTWNTMLG